MATPRPQRWSAATTKLSAQIRSRPMMLDLEDPEDDQLAIGPGTSGCGVLSSAARENEIVCGRDENYRVTSSDPIGSGTSGTVYAGVGLSSAQEVAIKVIDRMDIDHRPDKIKQMTRELNISAKLKHANIVNLLDVVFDEGRAMLVMEMAGGGMLYNLVADGTSLPEDRARHFFKQMVSAMEYCHGEKIYHRDLKLENVVLASEDVLKITDFGASKDASVNSLPKTHVGTISYMAPEVTKVDKIDAEHSYADGADIWSMGVILYVLVCCKYPFGFDGPRKLGGIPPHQVYERIRDARVEFPAHLSAELVELLRGIFTVKVQDRWTLARIRECAWLQAGPAYIPSPVSAGSVVEVVWPERAGGDACEPEALGTGGTGGAYYSYTASDTLQLGGSSLNLGSALSDDVDSLRDSINDNFAEPLDL